MIGLLQRVRSATVRVEDETIAHIGRGLLMLIGIEKNDGSIQAEKLVDKIVNYRVFEDREQRMNLSVRDIEGELLLVPQFTLVANTHKGLRPSFAEAMPPDSARLLFMACVDLAERQLPRVQAGCFGADMQVALVNDGPVTFWLQTQ